MDKIILGVTYHIKSWPGHDRIPDPNDVIEMCVVKVTECEHFPAGVQLDVVLDFAENVPPPEAHEKPPTYCGDNEFHEPHENCRGYYPGD